MKGVFQTRRTDGWEVVIARDLAEVELLRPTWEELQQNECSPVVNADIDRFISVVGPRQDVVRPHVILLRNSGNPKAMLIGRIEEKRLNCKIGYKTLLRPLLRCLLVVYGGLLGNLTDELCAMLIRELQDALGKGEADVVLFSHLRKGSPIYRCATTMPSFLCRGHLSKTEVHRSMSVPDSIDSFYKSRSKKHRANLRRYIRKLDEEYPDRVQTLSYRKVKDVGELITAASQISTQTYQQTLGSGFDDDERTRKLIETAARRGWLRAHVLYVGDEPCAFQCGLQYKKTYFLEKIGYSSQWGKYNVGSVLFLNVLHELCEEGAIETIDFGFGDADYKCSYGDKDWPEASVYIFAPRLYPLFINILQTSMVGISLGLESILSRTGLISPIKRRWRNLLQARNLKSTS